jgi:hypothetical protein
MMIRIRRRIPKTKMEVVTVAMLAEVVTVAMLAEVVTVLLSVTLAGAMTMKSMCSSAAPQLQMVRQVLVRRELVPRPVLTWMLTWMLLALVLVAQAQAVLRPSQRLPVVQAVVV